MNAFGPWIAPVVLFSIVLAIAVVLRERDRRRQLGKKVAKQTVKQPVWEALHPSGPSTPIGSYHDEMEDQSQGRKLLLQ